MKFIKNIIENSGSTPGRVFDLFIQSLIIASLITFSIETLPNLDQSTRDSLRLFEVASVLVFTAEYLLRIIVSDHKLKFVFSFFGLVDLLAILPFYLSTGIDLRALRVFRLLRLIRVFKLLKYGKAVSRIRRAFVMVKEELVLFSFVTVIVLFVAAVGIYYFENSAQPEAFSSVFASLWWAVITLTTVGYGEMYPITVGGKLFTFVVLMVGLGVVAVPTGLLASALSKTRDEEEDEPTGEGDGECL